MRYLLTGARHIIGYGICLAFITLTLTFSGPFIDVVRSSDTHVTTLIGALGFDPNIGWMTRITINVFGVSFTPALVIGHVLGIMISPIGLVAFMIYFIFRRAFPD